MTKKPEIRKMELLLSEIESLNNTIQVLSDENAHGKMRQQELEAVIVDLQEKLAAAAEERKAFAKEKSHVIIELQDEIIGLQTHLEMAEAKNEQLQAELDMALAEELTPEEYSSIDRALEETMPNNSIFENPAGALIDRLESNNSALEEKAMPNNPFIEQARTAKSAARIKMQGKAIHAGIHAAERTLTQFSKDTVKMHEASCNLQAQMTPEERMHTMDKRHDLLSTIVTEGFGLAKQWLEFKAWKAMNDESEE